MSRSFWTDTATRFALLHGEPDAHGVPGVSYAPPADVTGCRIVEGPTETVDGRPVQSYLLLAPFGTAADIGDRFSLPLPDGGAVIATVSKPPRASRSPYGLTSHTRIDLKVGDAPHGQ